MPNILSRPRCVNVIGDRIYKIEQDYPERGDSNRTHVADIEMRPDRDRGVPAAISRIVYG